MPQSEEQMRAAIAEVIRGRRWIVGYDVLVAAHHQATELLDLGAEKVLAIGGSRGTGALPDPPPFPCIDLKSSGEDMMACIRNGQAALAAVPRAVQAQIDAVPQEAPYRVSQLKSLR